jgi:hypothetical protein
MIRPKEASIVLADVSHASIVRVNRGQVNIKIRSKMTQKSHGGIMPNRHDEFQSYRMNKS